jgi:NAD(P)-dependent dehydrogenase (short-subunit alcohol dehydrogenase family)
MSKKIVVITGSSRGIGFHLASRFLSLGHPVLINGRHEDSLATACEKLKAINPDLHYVAGDVSLPVTHETLMAHAKERYGRIDIWINNAGIPQPYHYFSQLSTESIDRVIRINLTGTLFGTRIVLPFFLEQGFGALYNMEGFGSDGRMMNKLGLYGTTKRAVRYFTRSLSRESAKTPVCIGTINPGMVRTDFLDIERNFSSPSEEKRYDKVIRILAEDPEPVSRYVVDQILSNRKKFHAIRYLTGLRLASKIIRLAFG